MPLNMLRLIEEQTRKLLNRKLNSGKRRVNYLKINIETILAVCEEHMQSEPDLQ